MNAHESSFCAYNASAMHAVRCASLESPFCRPPIFTPMAIHLIGHVLLVPMLLRNALENYYIVSGSAGAIFGFLYYLITALVSFMVSSLHSNNIHNFAILFAILLFICLILFYLNIKWQKIIHKPIFD